MKFTRKLLSFILVVILLITSTSVSITSVNADSYETAIFPGSVLKVTQGAYGEFNSYSHNGQGGYYQNAFDLAGNSNYVAPFSGTITKIKTSYNAVILQSDNMVYWADGTCDYMSVCFVHDNDISDLYVGKKISQGDIFYQPGVKDPGGYTTGTHLHMCVNRGKTDAGLSIFSGDVRPNEAFFLGTDTNVQQTGGYDWKYVGGSDSYATIENGEYYLKNVATGQYLSVDGGYDAQAQNVSVADFTGGNEMKFEFVSESNGYALRPLCSSSRMLNIYADNVVSGKNVCIYDNTYHSSQRWKFEAVDGGYIVHSSNNPSCVLDVNGTNVQVSTNTGADSQKWVIESENTAVLPDKPTLAVVPGTSETDTQFTWEETANTDSYTLHIYNKTEDWKMPLFADITDLYINVPLPEGEYSAWVASINDELKDTDLWYTVSDAVDFAVEGVHYHEYFVVEEDFGDCQHYGYTMYQCECGESYIEEATEFGDHIPSDEWTVIFMPTETDRGVACKLCVLCNTQVEYVRFDDEDNIYYPENPEEPDTTPEEPDTTPEEPDTTPEEPDTTPEEPDTTPEVPDTTPEEPDTTPEEPDNPSHVYPMTFEIGAEINDSKTGDILFSWNEHTGVSYYNLKVYNNALEEELNVDVYDTIYLWDYVTCDEGMFTIAAMDENGNMLGESALVKFSRMFIMGDWWGQYGDADLDGKINIKDATVVQKVCAKFIEFDDTAFGAANVNYDDKINIKDATAIQKYLAHIESDSRVGEEYFYGFTQYEGVYLEV